LSIHRRQVEQLAYGADMQRVAAILMGLALGVATMPACAQNTDPFREDAPAAPAPPAPRPAPRPRPAPEPAVVVPSPSPQPNYDGVYSGTASMAGGNPRCPPEAGRQVTVAQGRITVTLPNGAGIGAVVDPLGKFDVSKKGFYGYFRIFGQIQGSDLSGRIEGQNCSYELRMTR
jgi:hypothetical protein